MQPIFHSLQQNAAVLFAAVILIVVFFLIARVVRARQPVALAFSMMPLLLALAFASLVQTETAIPLL